MYLLTYQVRVIIGVFLVVFICDIFKSLINSLVCWFCTDALGLFPFQILLLTIKLFWLLVCLGVCFKIKGNYYMYYFLCVFRSKR